MTNRLNEVCELGASEGTRKRDRTAWTKYWLPFCALLGTSPWRYSAVSDASLAVVAGHSYREVWLQCNFFLYAYDHMMPRRRSDVVPHVPCRPLASFGAGRPNRATVGLPSSVARPVPRVESHSIINGGGGCGGGYRDRVLASCSPTPSYFVSMDLPSPAR